MVVSNIAEMSFSEGILYTRLLEGKEIDLPNALDNFEKSKTLTKGRRFATLTDARATVTIKEANENLIAQAILIQSLANRIVGNFMIKFHKPLAPTRLFSNRDEAIAWLRERMKEDEASGIKTEPPPSA